MYTGKCAKNWTLLPYYTLNVCVVVVVRICVVPCCCDPDQTGKANMSRVQFTKKKLNGHISCSQRV